MAERCHCTPICTYRRDQRPDPSRLDGNRRLDAEHHNRWHATYCWPPGEHDRRYSALRLDDIRRLIADDPEAAAERMAWLLDQLARTRELLRREVARHGDPAPDDSGPGWEALSLFEDVGAQ